MIQECVTASKAQMLKRLESKLTKFNIPKFISFYAVLPTSKLLSLIDKIGFDFQSKILVVRSSAHDEDGVSKSFAGEYDSVLNIDSGNGEELKNAINIVIASYKKKRKLMQKDEIMVQEMVGNISMSGVVFTHDLNTGAPYYVINYDDQSGLSDTVTSGIGEHANRTLYIHRGSTDRLCSDRFIKLMQAVQELEQVMKSKFLDIEFAMDKNFTPYLLQVRSITTQPNWNRVVAKRVDLTLENTLQLIKERMKKINGVYGGTTIFGQMPDWNPVEMIGRAPRILATSLYQKLITDKAWSEARSIMGYATPPSQPLMLVFAGQPFIDTRLSFHSFLPKSISSHVAEKIVSHWVKSLKKSPELHDKIEFDVAITSYDLDFDDRVERLIGDVLTKDEKNEFKLAHLKQTRKLIKGEHDGSINNALDKINKLKCKQGEWSSLKNNHLSLFSMIDDCIRLGTIPFSILARHGFIAKTILSSLQRKSIFTSSEVNKIQAGVRTVASELVDDMQLLQSCKLTRRDFMEKYGHLRPGTYDIMAHRYDQMNNFIDESNFYNLRIGSVSNFELSNNQKSQINKLLKKDGFDEFNADSILDYIKSAIINREYGKFIFTRSVSDILEIIARYAEMNGLSRDEISHVPINSLLNTIKSCGEFNTEEQLREVSSVELEKHKVSIAVRFPQLLIDPDSVHIVPFQVSYPNYITHKKVTAATLFLLHNVETVILTNKIVIIEGADPGFDWIFSKKISGLITKYGGANSHMAIRCAEFGIPAAIGCGEQRFDALLKVDKVHLDCAAGLISPIH